MFAELGSHDKGTESGDGKDMSEILSVRYKDFIFFKTHVLCARFIDSNF